MDKKSINILLLVVGFVLFITGAMQVMAAPGGIDYFLVIIGILMVISAIVGLWKGKVV